jgi:hypothetical protein
MNTLTFGTARMTALAIAACAIMAPSGGRGALPRAPDDEATLRQLNGEYVASFVNSDPAHYDRLLAPEFVAIASTGALIDRATFLKNAANPSGMRSFVATDVAVQIVGDNVGIIQARTPYTRLDGTTGDTRYTDIWVKRDGRWWALRAQVTAIRTP